MSTILFLSYILNVANMHLMIFPRWKWYVRVLSTKALESTMPKWKIQAAIMQHPFNFIALFFVLFLVYSLCQQNGKRFETVQCYQHFGIHYLWDTSADSQTTLFNSQWLSYLHDLIIHYQSLLLFNEDDM